jgi:hypothetical protein
MSGIFAGPKIEINPSSGMISITVRSQTHWLIGVAGVGVEIFLAFFLHEKWSVFPLYFRIMWIWGLVSSAPALVYQFFGEEIIEFDAGKLTIRKGIHGWERKREYQVENCKKLEWQRARKNRSSGLRCKVGWRTITFAHNVSEDDTIKILTALQQVLPQVAQQIGVFPRGTEHFLTLGLGR